VPEGADLAALSKLTPIFLSYVLSFVFLGIYWNNHHHLLQVAKQVNGSVLWANLHLLFWLSLIPFVTSWMGDNASAQLPIALYGVVLWMSGLAYYILAHTLISLHGNDSLLATHWAERSKRSCHWSATRWQSYFHSSTPPSLLPSMYLSRVCGSFPTNGSRTRWMDNPPFFHCNKFPLDSASAFCYYISILPARRIK